MKNHLLAFQIAEMQKKTDNRYVVGGRAIMPLKVGDELFLQPDDKFGSLRIVRIVYFKKEIRGIDPPGTCYLHLEPKQPLSFPVKELFKYLNQKQE